MANIAKVEVPFSVIRLLLPADGEVTMQTLKKNKWKDEKEPFFRDECIEFAFGKKLRAKTEDRDKERWWKPGVVDHGDKVSVKGGWRVHKQIPAHSDYFDGTFQADMTPTIEDGQLVPKISNLNIEWNKSVAGKILDILVEAIEPIVERELQKLINKFLKEFLLKLVNEFAAKNAIISNLKARTRLSAKGTTIVLSVNVD